MGRHSFGKFIFVFLFQAFFFQSTGYFLSTDGGDSFTFSSLPVAAKIFSIKPLLTLPYFVFFLYEVRTVCKQYFYFLQSYNAEIWIWDYTAESWQKGFSTYITGLETIDVISIVIVSIDNNNFRHLVSASKHQGLVQVN